MEAKTTGNQLLSLLPRAAYVALFSRLKPVRFKSGQVLYEARSPIEYVYFPTSGTLSSVAVMTNGDIIEVATVGSEGAVGLPLLTTPDRTPNRVFVQVPGEGLRIECKIFEKAAQCDPPLQQLLAQYYTAFMFQVCQSVACNGLHVLPERCCRWLLMTHDRVAGDVLSLTHEMLAAMLGVRRPSVTEALQTLQERGLITYARGKITVIDRKGLERGSCECYRTVRDEYRRLVHSRAK